jgi:hypothetical protein
MTLRTLPIGLLLLASPAASAAPDGAKPLPSIAVAEIGEFHVAKTLGELGPDVVIKAAAQGVRDVCLDKTSNSFRAATSCQHPAASTPVGVCLDMTVERALARMAVCNSSDQTLQVVELSSSPCRTSECLKADARQAGMSRVLIVQGKSSDFGLDVAMDLIDLGSGAVRSKRYKDYFPPNERDDAAIVPRTGPQIIAIVHGMARDLVQESLKDEMAPKTAPATTSTVPPLAPPMSSAPADHSASPLPAWVGWTTVSVGAAAIVAGAVLWSLDGKPRGCSDASNGDLCAETWTTTKVAIPLVAVGAVAGGFGGWILYRSASGKEGSVAVVPGGVSLMGKF